MKTNKLEALFENLKNEFDIEEPNTGHELRFLSRLKGEDKKVVELKPNKFQFWKPLMAVAASVVLCAFIYITVQLKSEVQDLANVSPELSETQEFFTAAINQELIALNEERTPETEAIVKDALQRIELLEKEYESLKVDLTVSGNDQRVIYAMISNFQNRIDLLQSVLAQIKEVKQLKQNNNENKVTI